MKQRGDVGDKERKRQRKTLTKGDKSAMVKGERARRRR